MQPSFSTLNIFDIIGSKQHTEYNFKHALKKIFEDKKIPIRTLKDEREFTILHAVVEKNRLSFLDVIHQLGYWEELRPLKIPATSSQSLCADKDIREIAEKVVKSRKLLKKIDDIDNLEKSMTSISKACRSGNLEEVRRLIKERPGQIYEKDFMDCNPLYWACISGIQVIVEELYKAGAKPHNINKKGETLLHIVCIIGHSHLVHLLVKEYKVPTDPKDKERKTAICYTADNGDITTLKELLSCGLQLVPELVTLSAHTGRIYYLKYLIEDHNLDVNSRDENKKTAFLRAAEGGRKSLLEYLLTMNVKWDDADKRQRNVFHQAVDSGVIEVLEFLITKLKEANVQLLQHLINSQDIFVGGELCFLIRGKDKGRPAWHYVEVRRYLVHKFTAKTKSGSVNVALYGYVIKSGWGSDPNEAEMEEFENRLKQRTEVRPSIGDSTPLHMACFKEEVEMASLLLENGADPNIKDTFGLTPLHIACMRGHMELIMKLENHGADAAVTSNDGKTPLQVAEENNHTHVIHFLKGRGFFSRSQEFLSCFHQKLPLLRHDYLEKLRGEGKDVRKHLVDLLRDMAIDINQFLLDIGSGPVLEESSR